MKAVQFQPGLSLDNSGVALEVELDMPVPEGRDILVQVDAIGMNPVDTKVRPIEGAEPAVLGYDAAGTVAAVGEDVEILSVGDKVYYAGSITRPGANSEFHLVDERIAAVSPATLDVAGSAALPLTSLTAWESIFERLGVDFEGANKGQTLMIIGGAGGVGSMGIQLAKLAGLIVIATASREESADWCRELGADYVVNHRGDIPAQLKEHGFETVDYIANYNNTDAYWELMGELIAPLGRIVLIVEQSGDLDIGGQYKLKSVSVSWELMFTRSMFNTPDIEKQHEILDRISALIDLGKIKPTGNKTLSPISVKNIVEAHKMIESGKSIGKLVIEGWGEEPDE